MSFIRCNWASFPPGLITLLVVGLRSVLLKCSENRTGEDIEEKRKEPVTRRCGSQGISAWRCKTKVQDESVLKYRGQSVRECTDRRRRRRPAGDRVRESKTRQCLAYSCLQHNR